MNNAVEKLGTFYINKSILQAVKAEYAGCTSDNHIGVAVEFQEDTITLAVPVGGEVLENGWEITPLTPPTVSLL